jgi:hypothetical protein
VHGTYIICCNIGNMFVKSLDLVVSVPLADRISEAGFEMSNVPTPAP